MFILKQQIGLSLVGTVAAYMTQDELYIPGVLKGKQVSWNSFESALPITMNQLLLIHWGWNFSLFLITQKEYCASDSGVAMENYYKLNAYSIKE